MTILLLIIYLCFIGLGLPDSLLGAAWPDMYQELNVPVSMEAVGNSVIAVCTIISSLNFTRLVKKLGTYRIIVISMLLTTVAIFGYGLMPNYLCLLILGIPMGLGAGAIDSALNNYLALHYKASHMNWLHCFWGVGAMAGPVVMSAFMNHKSGWRQGYYVIGIIQVLIVVILLISAPIWKKHNETINEEETIVMKIADLIKIKGVKLSMLTFFCYCATEYTIVCWGSTYLVQIRDVSSPVAAKWISMYYFGISLGRILCGFVAMKIKNIKLIFMGLCTVLLGAIILLLPLPAYGALIGLLFIGFGCAPVFPGMISETPKRFDKRLSESVIAIEMTSAYIGAFIIPVLFGFLAAYISMSLIPIFVIILVSIIILSTTVLNGKKSNNNYDN